MEVGNACSVLVESKTDREKGDTSPLMQVIELTDLSTLVYTNTDNLSGINLAI